MSFASLERAVLASARIFFNNPKLKMDDICEWNTGEIQPQDGEVTSTFIDPGVYVTIKTENDKRKKSK